MGQIHSMTSIGIDIGSTTIKGALLGSGGRVLGSIERYPFPDPVPGLPTDHFEIDPSEVIERTLCVLKSLLHQAPHAKRLYLCGQMGGAVLCNQTGIALTRYLSWRDQRSLHVGLNGRTLLDSVRDKLGDGILTNIGQELKPGSTSVLLHVLAQSGIFSNDTYPATIADAVAAHLCRHYPKMHPTMAIGMLDLEQPEPRWHHGMIQSLQLDGLKWPAPATIEKKCGVAVVDGVELDVYPAVGDQQSALLGSGLQENELSLNVSTGAQVSRLVDRLSSGCHQTRYFFCGKLLETITHIPAGRSLHAIVDILTELSRVQGLPVGDPWKTLVHLMDQAESIPMQDELKVGLSFYLSPVGDQGFVQGITLGNFSAGRLMLAATQNLADNLARCAKLLNHNAFWKQVRLSGGLSQSLPQLVRCLSNHFGHDTIVESVQVEETLAGLARLAQNSTSVSSTEART